MKIAACKEMNISLHVHVQYEGESALGFVKRSVPLQPIKPVNKGIMFYYEICLVATLQRMRIFTPCQQH